MRRVLLTCALLIGAALVLSGCLEDQIVDTQDLAVSPPWEAPESLSYVLLDRGDSEEIGRGSLEVAEVEGGFELSQEFGNEEGDFDNSSVIVNATTLKPISGERNRLVDDEAVQLRWTYDTAENIVEIIEIEEDGDEREIPKKLERHYYDNDSLLFVWRSIPFAVGFEAKHYTVVTGSGEQHIVALEVVRKEPITVPAGTFDTWRVEIRGSDVNQVAWYADTPEHPLIQYDNSEQFFQLLEAP
jgi:hypothetical protein